MGGGPVGMEQKWLKGARLVGDKVVLRPVGPGDVQDCFDRVHDRPEITDWLVWDGPESLEEIFPWYLTWPLGDATRGFDYHFAVLDRSDGSFSGAISLRYHDHTFQGDIGYWIAVDKWGRGLASEAVGMLTWLAFEHTAAQLMYAECFEGNLGSLRVLDRWGYQLDPSGERRIQKRGQEVLVQFLSLARSRWIERGRPGQPVEQQVDPN